MGQYRRATISGIERRRYFLNAQTSICPAGRPQTGKTPDTRETTGHRKPSSAKEEKNRKLNWGLVLETKYAKETVDPAEARGRRDAER